MAGIIGTNIVTQIGIVVRDIEVTKQKFAAFFGIDAPPTYDSGKYEITQTIVDGKPAPEAACLMAFFDVGIELELIQPNDAPSTWREFLDNHGEGIHHISFGVKNTDEKIRAMEAFGMTCVQRGKYGGGNGEYAYLDASKDMKLMLELLESYD